MGTVKSMDQARALKEAREILKASTLARGFIWKRQIDRAYMTGLNRRVLVELLPSFELRVTDSKTGEVITQGPAWVEGGDRFSPSP